MKYKNLYWIFLVFLTFPLVCSAQYRNRDFSEVDNYVKSLGPLDSMNMGTISFTLTKRFTENVEKVRAIYDWVAMNISFDCKTARNGNNAKAYYAEEILKTRKATSSGYASLFQDLCSVARIRCLTVDGYIKRTAEDINEKPDEFNHTWVVVQLGQSPDNWFYADPTFGSGFTDEKMTVFTKNFNTAYFFPDKKLFNLQHYPDNTAWILDAGSKSLSDFLALPVIRTAAFEYGIRHFTPEKGIIKSKAGKTISFSIALDGSTDFDIVALAIGPEKKKQTKIVDFRFSGGAINFSYKFDQEDTYPVAILINGKEIIKYMVDITE